MPVTQWKRPARKGYLLCDSKPMAFWKRQNGGDSKKIRAARGCGEEGRTQGVQGRETAL